MIVNKNIEFTYHLTEINTGDMLNSILDDNNNIITKLFQCKDYMQDIYWAELNNKKISQYGLIYDGENQKNILGKKTIKLLITSKDPEHTTSKSIQKTINLLNIIEDILNIDKSTYEKVDDSEDVVVFFDESWFKTSYMISLFMLFIKTGMYFDGENIDDIIEYYKKNITKHNSNYQNQILFLNKYNILKNFIINNEFPDHAWDKYLNVSQVHDKGGLISVINYYNYEKLKEYETSEI